jgi:hypothetical protein
MKPKGERVIANAGRSLERAWIGSAPQTAGLTPSLRLRSLKPDRLFDRPHGLVLQAGPRFGRGEDAQLTTVSSTSHRQFAAGPARGS